MDNNPHGERLAKLEERMISLRDDLQEVKSTLEKLDAIWRGVLALVAIEVIRQALNLVVQ
jgi:hypothetical protein